MQNLQDNPYSNVNKVIVKFLLASALVYSLLGLFGGLPASADASAFIIGLVVLFLSIVALLSFGWYAVAKPLPANLAPSRKLPLSHTLRQGTALFLVVMSGVGIAGGLWDITWHVRSGLPFGEDFFWEPHQFIYVALTAPIMVAALIWFRLLRNSSGTWRQRFQADIPVTALMLGGISMLLTLPADPVWHLIYGEDLTGLSVPHIVFSISGTITTLAAASILLSYLPMRRTWESIAKINLLEFLVVLSLSFTYMALLMPMLGDWEALTLSTSVLPRLPALVEARPDWAMPFMAAFATIFPAAIALHITRRVGAATLLWVITAFFRSVMYVVFDYENTGMVTMFLMLPFVIALDAAAWYSVSRNQPVTSVRLALAAGTAGTFAALPQIALFFTDPILTSANVPLMIAAMFVAALAASWMGTTLGVVTVNTPRFEMPLGQPVIAKRAVQVVSALAIIIMGAAAFFVMTATMPGL